MITDTYQFFKKTHNNAETRVQPAFSPYCTFFQTHNNAEKQAIPPFPANYCFFDPPPQITLNAESNAGLAFPKNCATATEAIANSSIGGAR